MSDEIDAMLLSHGALCGSTTRPRRGIIVAQQHRAYDPAKTVPTIILRNDDYGRIERLLADGRTSSWSSTSSTAPIPRARPVTTW